jgi:ketosteroid isomerase-like protein
MSAAENKRALQSAFEELANGNGKPFGDLMADDIRWTIIGTTKWSKTYDGKPAVLERLLRPLFSNFADRLTNTARRFVAEDDHVVVEARGHATTKAGVPYNNSYCYVIRFADGKMRELTEYMDTELVTRALREPLEGPER